MRLNVFTDYCLRVLMFVATRPQGRSTIADIAKAYAISEHHVVKVVHRLGQEGLLLTTRGRGGGLALARPAREIGLGEVVRRVEGEGPVVDCTACAIAPACRLAAALAEATRAFHGALDRHTLEDLTRNREALSSVLHPLVPVMP